MRGGMTLVAYVLVTYAHPIMIGLIYSHFLFHENESKFQDVTSRGIDVPMVDMVIQYSAPHQIADYVHRVGRTARAGRTGSAVLFLAPNETDFIRTLEEKRIRYIPLPQVTSALHSIHLFRIISTESPKGTTKHTWKASNWMTFSWRAHWRRRHRNCNVNSKCLSPKRRNWMTKHAKVGRTFSFSYFSSWKVKND